MKVIVTPFHSGADKPAHINIPVSGLQVRLIRYPWPYSKPAAPPLPRQFQSRRKSMPSKSASSTAGEMLFNCLQRRRTDTVQSRLQFIISEEKKKKRCLNRFNVMGSFTLSAPRNAWRQELNTTVAPDHTRPALSKKHQTAGYHTSTSVPSHT